MYCSSCGIKLIDGAAFCQECGEPQATKDIVVGESTANISHVFLATKEYTVENQAPINIAIAVRLFVAVIAIVFGVLGVTGNLARFQNNTNYISKSASGYGKYMNIDEYNGKNANDAVADIQSPIDEISSEKYDLQQPISSSSQYPASESNDSSQDGIAGETAPAMVMVALPSADAEAEAEPEPVPIPYTSQRVLVRNNDNIGWTLELEEWVDSAWTVMMQTTAYVGKNGTSTNTREGDQKTPAGEYNILFCFGIQEPTTNLRFKKISKGDIFVDDGNSLYYNTIIHAAYVRAGTSHENVYDHFSGGSYNTCIFFDFNGDGENANTATSGRGSVRTLRGNTGTLKETRGDIDISSEAMSALLAFLDSEKHPIIDIG